jgi:hypothetical protein
MGPQGGREWEARRDLVAQVSERVRGGGGGIDGRDGASEGSPRRGHVRVRVQRELYP